MGRLLLTLHCQLDLTHIQILLAFVMKVANEGKRVDIEGLEKDLDAPILNYGDNFATMVTYVLFLVSP